MDFLRVNHYLCAERTGRPLLPPSILPSITLPHRDRHLTLTPFSLCVLFFSPHISNTRGGLLLRENNITPSAVRDKHRLAYLAEPNSCFLIKSKQPLAELLPCYLTPATHLINPRSPDAEARSGSLYTSIGSRLRNSCLT